MRRMNLGEADRIITFITPDHGKLKAVARGVRRIKSRLAGHLELFGDVQLMLARGHNLDVITSARAAQSHLAIADDLERLSQAYLMAEMVDKLVREESVGPGVYRLVHGRIAFLDQSVNPRPNRFLTHQFVHHLGH